jgi:hypothetical protein
VVNRSKKFRAQQFAQLAGINPITLVAGFQQRIRPRIFCSLVPSI